MNNFYDFLWKTFGAVTVFFVCTGGITDLGGIGVTEATIGDNVSEIQQKVQADYASNFTIITTPAEDPKIQSYFISSSQLTGRKSNIMTICPSGYYLARCSSKTLGIQWLKGMSKLTTSADTIVRTPDYYSYDTDTVTADSTNMGNLRKFFAAKEAITYTPKNSSTQKTVNVTDYKEYKNQILSNYCTNETGELSNFECEKCPNGAMISTSTVQQDTEAPESLLWDTWSVHTIADCYLQEFQDDTGSYVYVANNASRDKKNKLNCYYNQALEGSQLN